MHLLSFLILSAGVILASASLFHQEAPKEWVKARFSRRAVAVLVNSKDVQGTVILEEHHLGQVHISGNITGLAPNSKFYEYTERIAMTSLRSHSRTMRHIYSQFFHYSPYLKGHNAFGELEALGPLTFTLNSGSKKVILARHRFNIPNDSENLVADLAFWKSPACAFLLRNVGAQLQYLNIYTVQVPTVTCASLPLISYFYLIQCYA